MHKQVMEREVLNRQSENRLQMPTEKAYSRQQKIRARDWSVTTIGVQETDGFPDSARVLGCRAAGKRWGSREEAGRQQVRHGL